MRKTGLTFASFEDSPQEPPERSISLLIFLFYPSEEHFSLLTSSIIR